MNTHCDQQSLNLYLYEQWNTLENYRSTLERYKAYYRAQTTMDEHRQQIRVGTLRNPKRSKLAKVKLFASSTKNTNITADGSKKDEKIGYAVVLSDSTIRSSQFHQNSIYSDEQSALINAIYSSSIYNQKRVIITDLFSTTIAVSIRKRSNNPKTQLIRKLIDQASTNIT
jgi:dsRNA-specific ribonuclease